MTSNLRRITRRETAFSCSQVVGKTRGRVCRKGKKYLPLSAFQTAAPDASAGVHPPNCNRKPSPLEREEGASQSSCKPKISVRMLYIVHLNVHRFGFDVEVHHCGRAEVK